MLTLISKLLPIAKKPGSVFKRTRPGVAVFHSVELHEIQLGGGYVYMWIYEYTNVNYNCKQVGIKKAHSISATGLVDDE